MLLADSDVTRRDKRACTCLALHSDMLDVPKCRPAWCKYKVLLFCAPTAWPAV